MMDHGTQRTIKVEKEKLKEYLGIKNLEDTKNKNKLRRKDRRL